MRCRSIGREWRREERAGAVASGEGGFPDAGAADELSGDARLCGVSRVSGVRGNVVMQLDDYRGVYNSAWVGALMGVVTSTFLTLAGFYIVKGSILRDETTRVGQILAATPMSKGFYTVAKVLGNFAVLAAMVTVMGVAALAMQLVRAEDRTLHVWTLLSPLLLYALPAMAFVAALAGAV